MIMDILNRNTPLLIGEFNKATSDMEFMLKIARRMKDYDEMCVKLADEFSRKHIVSEKYDLDITLDREQLYYNVLRSGLNIEILSKILGVNVLLIPYEFEEVKKLILDKLPYKQILAYYGPILAYYSRFKEFDELTELKYYNYKNTKKELYGYIYFIGAINDILLKIHKRYHEFNVIEKSIDDSVYYLIKCFAESYHRTKYMEYANKCVDRFELQISLTKYKVNLAQQLGVNGDPLVRKLKKEIKNAEKKKNL